MDKFNQEKLKKILFEWKCKPEWEYWSQLSDERKKTWMEGAEQNYSKIGYPDPETAVARALMRDF